MATLPDNTSVDLKLAIDELESAIVDMESRLESAQAERDEATARQTELEQENARLRHALGLAREQQSASADVLSTIANASGDAEHALRQIAETSARLFGATSATIQIAEGDSWVKIIRVGDTSRRVGETVPVAQLRIGGNNMPGTIVAENRQVHVPDLDNVDPAIADWPGLAPSRAAGTRSMSGSPLRREGKAIGALIVYRDRLAPFTDGEMLLQQSFADQAAIAIENSSLFNETREALERQTATADILKVIAGSPSNVQPVFEAIVESAKRLAQGHTVVVTRVIDNTVHLAAFSMESDAGVDELKSSFPAALSSQGIHSRVARSGQLAFRADMENEPDLTPAMKEMARARGYRSILVVPMLREGVAIGTISVSRPEAGPFDDKVVDLLTTFADQAVIAIENARLIRETQEALERQTATADILKVIASSPSDVQPVFEAIAVSAKHLLGGFSATVLHFIGDELHLVAFTPTNPAADEGLKASFPRRTAEFPIFELIRDGATIQFPDTEAENVPVMNRDLGRLRGFRSVLFVPLMSRGKPVGILSITRTTPGAFAEHHVQLLQTFADQAVIAIENTRLFNETREALERQTATADILKVIASSPSDVQPVFDAIVHSANRLIDGFSTAVYRLIDGIIHIAAFTPTNPEADAALRAEFPRHRNEIPPLARAKNGEIVQIADSEAADPITLRIGRARGWRSVLFTPLMNMGVPIGYISVTRRESGAFAEHHVQLLQTFADQAVIAIENTRLFNETQEALERQTATADILKVIASSPSNVQPVFEAIVGSAATLFEPCAATIVTLKDDKLHWNATVALHPDFDVERARAVYPLPFEPDHILSARAIAERQILEIPDIESSDTPDATRRAGRISGFRSVTFVPLINDAQGIGTIILTHPQAGFRLSDKQLALVKTFADQAVIAIQNTRLFNETREALERQTATADILKVIASSPSDVQPVFDAIAHRANRLIGGLSAAVFRYGDGKIHLAAFTPTDAEGDAVLQASFPIPQDQFPPYQLTREGAPAELPDTETEPAARDIARARGYRSMLFAPLMNDGEAVGIITVTRVAPGPFAEQHTRLLRMFADQAVIAIKNVGLFNEVKARTEELSESLQQQTAVGDVLKTISRSTFDLQPVLDTLVNTAALLCNADMAFIMRRVGDEYRAGAAVGYTEAYIDFLEHHPLAVDRGTVTGRAVIERRPVQILDVVADPEYTLRETTSLAGQRTALGVPLLRENEPIGVIVLARSRVEAFSQKQVDLVATFADQAVIAIENVRLFDELRQRTEDLSESLQQQTATADVLKVISRSAFDLQKVLDTLSESAAGLCEADIVIIHRRVGEGFPGASSFGMLEEHHRAIMEINHTPGRGSLGARVLLENAPVLIEDAESDPEYNFALQRDVGIRSMMGVPLLREGAAIGLLLMFRKKVQPFTQRHVDLAMTFADQAVIAIENVRLFDEVQARTRDLTEALTYQTGSGNILRVIASSPTDVGPVLNAIVESACELCDAKDAIVFLKEGDHLTYEAHHGPIPVVFGARRAINRDYVAGRSVVDRMPVHVSDVFSNDGVDFPEARELSRSQGIRSILSVPMLRESEGIGAILLRRAEVHPFTDKQISLLQTFADQAVIAIGNVRLFDEVQAKTRDLSEALQQQTATSDVLKVISRSAFNLQAVLDTLVESAARLCESDKGVIFKRDGDLYRWSANFGNPPELETFAKANPFKPGRYAVTSRVALEGKTFHVADVLADPEYGASQYQKLGGYRTILCVPLLREGVPIGVFALTRSEVRPFTERQIELVQTFADQAVIAIENVRLFDEVQARTKELAASLDELRTAQDRLIQTEKLASLGQLTAGIAHEIKNPLNFVNNFAALSAELTDELNDVLKPAEIAEKIREEVDELTGLLKSNLEKVVQHGKRADSIVKNMLLHSREGSGDHRPADINALVDESLNLAYHGARAERPDFNVTLERDFDPAAGMIDVFPQEISRVFLNLVSNGFYAVTKRRREHGEPGFEPTLRATTKNLGDTVEIRIRDNGIGIPPEVKEKMFNPFFTTKPAGEGTGLGLSMSHDIIVKQHGGTIDVDSEPGHFTEFRIVLPRASNFADKSRG